MLHVEQTRDPNLITANATLLLTYSPDAKGACPSRLFFKQNPMPAEAKFYQEIAPTLSNTVVPVCFDAQYDDTNSHVLLAYVERTHFALPETLPASLIYSEMIVDALADVHYQFWDHPRLRQDIGVLARDVPAFSHTIGKPTFCGLCRHARRPAVGEAARPLRKDPCSIPALSAQRAKDAGAWRCALGELPLPV